MESFRVEAERSKSTYTRSEIIERDEALSNLNAAKLDVESSDEESPIGDGTNFSE